MNEYRTMRLKARRESSGFSLVEMAIVLAIVALLLGGLLPTISGQMEQQHRNETSKYLDEVRDALLGYAVANGRLPCPDTNGDGTENAPCTSTATQQFGTLPYNNLGVGNKDAYGKELVYAVTKEFASSATPFTLSTAGTMRICTTSACTSPYLTSTAVAVILSRGANWAAPHQPMKRKIPIVPLAATPISSAMISYRMVLMIWWFGFLQTSCSTAWSRQASCRRSPIYRAIDLHNHRATSCAPTAISRPNGDIHQHYWPNLNARDWL